MPSYICPVRNVAENNVEADYEETDSFSICSSGL